MTDRPRERKSQPDVITGVLACCPEVKFAYIFGSRARGDAGPLSDVDVAVFLDGRVEPFDCRLRLMEKLSRIFGESLQNLWGQA